MRRNLHAGKTRFVGASLNLLSETDLDEIHLATLEVLQKTGIFVEDEQALEVFHGGGAEVDRASKTVRIPPHLLEDAVRWAPRKICLAGRNPKNDIVIEADRVGFTNFGEGVNVVDPYTGTVRPATKKDVADTAKVADYLSDVDVYERAVGAHDVPEAVGQLHNAEAMFPNTSKHCFMGPFSGTLLKKLLEMAAAVVGGKEVLKRRPILSFITCPVSPLRLVRDCCEIIMEAARANTTVNVLSMAMSGGSSPVTLAGTLVTHNAEVLSGVVLNQLTRKGAPVVYGSSTTCMDLRKAVASVGSPELGLINAAVAQLARFYQLPSWVAGG